MRSFAVSIRASNITQTLHKHLTYLTYILIPLWLTSNVEYTLVYNCFFTLTNCGKTRPNSTLFFPAFFGKSLSLSPANVLNSSGISELLSRYPDKRFVDILIAIATTGARLGYVDPIMKQNSTTKSRFMLHARGRH